MVPHHRGEAMMRVAAVRAGLVSMVVLSASIAAADVDLSGAWGVKTEYGYFDWFGTQSGTTFTLGGFSGSIDPAIRDFGAASNEVPCRSPISGAVAPDSSRFPAA